MEVILRANAMLICVVSAALGSVIPAKSLSNGGSQFHHGDSSSGYIVTAGGWNGNNFFTNVYALDLNSGKWTDLPFLPQGLCCFNLVLSDSSVYAVAGQSASVPNSMNTFILSVKENMWKTGSDLIYSSGHVLSTSFNGSIYGIGGSAGSNALQVIGCSGAWSKLTSSIYHHDAGSDAIAVQNNKFYVLGCHHTDEMYDPSTDTWTAIKMTNEDRCNAGIVALNGYIYVIGGADAKNERYDPGTGDLIYFEACLFNMVETAGVVTDGAKIYVIGGMIDGVYTNRVQVYRPDLDLWQSMTQYPVAVRQMGAVYMNKLPNN